MVNYKGRFLGVNYDFEVTDDADFKAQLKALMQVTNFSVEIDKTAKFTQKTVIKEVLDEILKGI